MQARWSAICFRFASLLLLTLVPHVTLSDETSDPVEGGQRFVEVGQLAQVRNGPKGELRFALLDQHGEVIASLRPASGVDLRNHLGEEVGVTARTLVNSDTPVLLAENVTTFGAARQLSNDDIASQVALASHESELSVMSPSGAGVAKSIVTDHSVEDHLVPSPLPMEYATSEYPVTGAPIISTENYLPSAVHSTCGIPGCESCGGGCGQVACQSCAACPCGLPGRFWIRGESLIWWTNGMNTPALLVSSPPGTAQRNAGVLGVQGNTTLFGGEDLFTDSRSGGRFRFGKWFDRCNWVGFETDFFFLNGENNGFHDCTVGNQIIGRPFTDAEEGPSAELIDFPGLVAGTAHIDAETSLLSVNPRLRVNLSCENFATPTRFDPCATGGYRFDMLVGYRYMRLDDDLTIRENLMAPTAGANGQIPLIPRFDNVTYFDIRDSFSTSNDFHGADIGLAWEGYRGRWSLELLGKVGIGSTSQEVNIRGNTTRVANNNSFNDEGGLLALESNIGSYSRNEFTVLPEFGATLGYGLSPRMRFLVGYTFVYWSDVVRAGDQIDTTVNTDLLPDVQPTTGPNRPEFSFVDTSFWAQGLSLGLDYRW